MRGTSVRALYSYVLTVHFLRTGTFSCVTAKPVIRCSKADLDKTFCLIYCLHPGFVGWPKTPSQHSPPCPGALRGQAWCVTVLAPQPACLVGRSLQASLCSQDTGIVKNMVALHPHFLV